MTSGSMLIAVALPVYNSADTLSRAVKSIQNQTFRDWNLVLYDDGSTDGSLELAQNLAKTDSRIRVICRPHAGIVETLQNAAAAADTPYIARMDADDAAHPERFERQFALIESDPRIALCGTGVRMTGPKVGYGRRRYETWINSLNSHEEIVRDLFVECPIPHPTFLIRRDAFMAVGGYRDFGWAEDYDIVMRLFVSGFRFAKVNLPLLDWTDSPQRLSMTAKRYGPEQFRKLKIHYLLRTHLKNRNDFHQWGAGEVGKKWLRQWTASPALPKPHAVVDINPRKLGKTIHGIPVIPPQGLPPPGHGFTLVAVGAPGARTEIRDWFVSRGYDEGVDFVFLA